MVIIACLGGYIILSLIVIKRSRRRTGLMHGDDSLAQKSPSINITSDFERVLKKQIRETVSEIDQNVRDQTRKVLDRLAHLEEMVQRIDAHEVGWPESEFEPVPIAGRFYNIHFETNLVVKNDDIPLLQSFHQDLFQNAAFNAKLRDASHTFAEGKSKFENYPKIINMAFAKNKRQVSYRNTEKCSIGKQQKKRVESGA